MTAPFTTAETTGEKPVEVFHFSYQAQMWRLTSHESAVTTPDGETYTPTLIRRSNIGQSEEQASATVEISLPALHPIAQLFIAGNPSRPVMVSVRRYHETTQVLATIFAGEISEPRYDGGECTFVCAPIRHALTRKVLNRLVTKQCAWNLYGPGCGLDHEDFNFSIDYVRDVVDPLLYSVQGSTLDAQNPATGYFNGGIFRTFFGQAAPNFAFIETYTYTPGPVPNKTIRLMAPIREHGPGSGSNDGHLHPGCNRTMADCEGKFNNLERFGGFPFFPLKSPFDGVI